MYLRLAILVLLLICLLLSTIEFVLNVKSNNQNVDYQKMLAKTLQAEEGISALTLFTRNFVNINLGFENKNSTYFQNRQSQIRK